MHGCGARRVAWFVYRVLWDHCCCSSLIGTYPIPVLQVKTALGCTDTVSEEPHPRPTRWRVRDAVDFATVPRRATSAACFFFFFPRLAPTRLKLGPIHAKSGWFAPTRAVSAVSSKTADMVGSSRNRWIWYADVTVFTSLTPFVFFFFFASSSSSSFFFASPTLRRCDSVFYFYFYKFCFVFFFF